MQDQQSFRPHLCCFMDVLGFTALVRSKDSIEKLRTYVATIQVVKSMFPKEIAIKFLAVSDSIIMAIEMNPNSIAESRVAAKLLMQHALILQDRLSDQGIWTRGGIAYGNLEFQPEINIILGEAFIRAVELEKLAKFPRIIVDTGVVEALGYGNVRDMVESMNRVVPMSINGQKFTNDVLFNVNNHDFRVRTIVADRPLFLDWGDYCAQFSLEVNRKPMCLSYLAKDILGKIEHYEKYNWMNTYLYFKFLNYQSHVIAKEVSDELGKNY